MPNFFRLYDNLVYDTGPVERLGWSVESGFTVPASYIEKGEFFLMRMCNGLGDWGIISAMPRLLKQKYPYAKVYLPSPKFIEKVFGDSAPWKHWPEPTYNCEKIFKHNPYVDGFLDEVQGEVYHDHFRIYDPSQEQVPLAQQMLKFWGLSEEEIQDCLPEIYFSEEEKEQGDELITKYFGNEPFAGLITTASQLKQGQFFEDTQNYKLQQVLKDYPLSYVYYGGVSVDQTPFADSVEVKLDFQQVPTPMRVQLYIRSKAKVNIGYQSSIFEIVSRYSQIICTPMKGGVRENFLPGIKYIV